MLLSLPTSLLLAILPTLTTAANSTKRGLVYIGSQKHPNDASVWTTDTDLSWYYNYGLYPTPQLTSSSLHFVPMLWGAAAKGQETAFLDAITSAKKSGVNITHVLGFNEPDMSRNVGGSDMSPSDASSIWQKQLEPLRKLGIKVGAPVVSGSPVGYAWMKQWEDACNGNCNPDFIPTHWYGNFEGLAGWLGNQTATYPEKEIWMTEWALPDVGERETEGFVNQSVALMDRWSNVTRYSYFGSFRSDMSNVGSSAAMLNKNGQLTDVGRLYLGPGAKDATSDATGFMAMSSGSSVLGLPALALLMLLFA